ncbi:helix-turn-helix domain-containing protein [Clostridium felsineum]|uniref:helix-turn-helix domain-containing protein n=1 Tax=Clostridium felsineum TaxID=36839 RepID=UPI00098C1912|nr:helix-turn-helix transcriptional regulator [Clostridium felsineum]URZ18686.1 hypothetical protein CLFE_047740 [Clostridium felsineum DSM 794]
MVSYKIMSVANKLKNIRDKYGLSQEDLAGNEITRNLISQIEHNKANLTRSSAEIMLKNLMKICNKKKIKVDENIDYLLEDESSQAKKILNKYISDLKDLSVYKDPTFINKLKEIEAFLVTWDFKEKKISIFELAGDYFSGINDFYNASLYYEKAKALIDVNIYTDNFIHILRKLSMTYYYMRKYQDDIDCCEFALKQFKDMDDDYKCIFLFNSSLCYGQLEKYDVALNRLNKVEGIIKNIDQNKYYEVLIQKAICYQWMKEYQKSLDVYNKLLTLIDKTDYEKYLFILVNSADIYVENLDFETVKIILNTIFENINNLSENSTLLPSTYLEISKVLKKLGYTKDAEVYGLKSLNIAKRNTSYYLVNDIYEELLDIYTMLKAPNKVETIKKEFFITTTKDNNLNSKLMFKLLDFYFDIKDLKSLKEIYDFSKDFIQTRTSVTSKYFWRNFAK